MAELSKRQAAADTEKHEASISKNAETIFNSPRGVTVGNKDGDVTSSSFSITIAVTANARWPTCSI